MPHAVVVRAKIVLLAAEGLENTQIATRLDVHVNMVSRWRGRFAREGLDGLGDRRRPGRPRVFPAAVVAEVKATACEPPEDRQVPSFGGGSPEKGPHLRKPRRRPTLRASKSGSDGGWNAWRPLVNTDEPVPGLYTAERRVREIQAKLHRWASDDPHRRFDDLYNLVCDPAFVLVAWDRVRHNKGARSAGVDGRTAYAIEAEIGVEVFCDRTSPARSC